MPSASDRPDPAGAGRDPELVLAAVKAEGARRRRRRHHRNVLAGGVAALALAVPAAAALTDGGGTGDLRVASAGAGGDGVGTTTPVGAADGEATATTIVLAAPTAPTTVPPLADPTVATVATATTTPPATARPRPTTAPTAPTTPPCRNAAEPRCGAFRWDPAPAPNSPLMAAFTHVPAQVVAGEPVEFEVTWTDADATLSFDHFSTDGTALAGGCSTVPRHGPWDAPTPRPGAGALRYEHTFPAPGTYVVTVSLATSVLDGDCADPYASETVVERTVEVVAAP